MARLAFPSFINNTNNNYTTGRHSYCTVKLDLQRLPARKYNTNRSAESVTFCNNFPSAGCKCLLYRIFIMTIIILSQIPDSILSCQHGCCLCYQSNHRLVTHKHSAIQAYKSQMCASTMNMCGRTLKVCPNTTTTTEKKN